MGRLHLCLLGRVRILNSQYFPTYGFRSGPGVGFLCEGHSYAGIRDSLAVIALSKGSSHATVAQASPINDGSFDCGALGRQCRISMVAWNHWSGTSSASHYRIHDPRICCFRVVAIKGTSFESNDCCHSYSFCGHCVTVLWQR